MNHPLRLELAVILTPIALYAAYLLCVALS